MATITTNTDNSSGALSAEESCTRPRTVQKEAMRDIDNELDVSILSDTPGETQEPEVIAKQEGRVVFILRMLVLLILVASAIGVSLGVYYYTTNQEETSFKDHFDADALKVLESIGSTVEETLGATDAFITHLVAYARYSNSPWPFVTMPQIAIHATKLLKLSKAFHFALTPFVEPEQKDQWERYANASDSWIYESLAIQARDKDWYGPKEDSFITSYEIYDFSRPNHTVPYHYRNNFAPYWQGHPQVPSAQGFVYNFDVWQVPELATSMIHADEQKKVVVSPHVNAVYDPTSEASIAVAKGQSDWAKAYARPGVDTNEPFSVITFPIYDAFEDVRLDVSQDLPYVGVLMFSIFWREMLENILPEGEGVVVVFNDTCAPPFTYRLDGNEAVFLGQGDLHDSRYDRMYHSAVLHELASPSDDGSSYTGLPISATFCPRTITVYPSNSLEDEHVTSDPIWFTLVVVSTFLFTSFVFTLYDYWTNRRKRIIMNRALASGAIVSSLFPQNVTQQLTQEKEQQVEKDRTATSRFARECSLAVSGRLSMQTRLNSKPIAQHFENTTIFFADLVGFTAWSSKRSDPTAVFQLLEALYGKFDQIALRRKVFKVETIGDCYVAVTGLPHPQELHASIMARFAQDCLGSIKEVLRGLVDTLGEDTMDLDMRVGLHSGKVTAGVLRGEKGRFQLFGDSVNTAARMESNGKAGLIHCSAETASALQVLGKGAWVTPREDKIIAKGKGEMQTFWINIGTSDRRTITSSASVSTGVGDSGAFEDEAEGLSLRKEEGAPFA